MDFELARERMVESQLRPNAVTDTRLLVAMLEVEREKFLPASLRPVAYLDEDLVISDETPGGPARFIVEPMVFARLVQLAGIGPDDLVLDVGAASGYSSAVIARLASAVVGIESDSVLAERAAAILMEEEVDTVAVFNESLAEGFAEQGPYDVIVLEGSVEVIPDDLVAQLRDGGRLVCVLREGPVGRGMLYRKVGNDLSGTAEFDANTLPLPGFDKEPAFVF